MVYIDTKFHCHTANPEGKYRQFDIPFFNDKCKEFIEGYLYIPHDEVSVLDDGVLLRGEMIAPWKPYSELDAAQRQYELAQLADYKAACERMGIKV